ncbi:hypothetical protein ASD8599_01794 [Ascidiaceihabitans donghaensis]|uniref:Uncharacterized protein n=1 Tax=Ascidiaceihabitans donghaensis TaxID=1510460 RepID=A0A2R8BDC8_9RHOB|nr:hypothetical protein ASD8599_01794 [Ascidiaceihabitans donghaensis]
MKETWRLPCPTGVWSVIPDLRGSGTLKPTTVMT